MGALKEFYYNDCVPALKEEFGYTNIMQVPKLEKIVLNMGLGEAVQNPKIVEGAAQELTLIAGQKAVVTNAKKSIAGFKLREGMPIGCKVTLRRQRMWEFLDRLVSLAIPRVRDFRGLSTSAFDGNGNYSMGLVEQLVFPELNPDKFTRPQGMDVTLVTSTDQDDEARELLRGLGMPLQTT